MKKAFIIASTALVASAVLLIGNHPQRDHLTWRFVKMYVAQP